MLWKHDTAPTAPKLSHDEAVFIFSVYSKVLLQEKAMGTAHAKI